MRERRQVNLQEGGPARDREQVRIRCREAFAQEKRLLREMPIQIREALVELLDRCRTGLFRGGVGDGTAGLITLDRSLGRVCKGL